MVTNADFSPTRPVRRREGVHMADLEEGQSPGGGQEAAELLPAPYRSRCLADHLVRCDDPIVEILDDFVLSHLCET